MMARAAIRDAGRVLEVPYGTVDRIAKMVPEGVKVYLDDSLKPGQELRAAYDSDPLVKEIVDLAKPLEGLVRQDSIHAAGVVISDRPLTDVVPLQQKGAEQEVLTQFAMNDVEALGLLKMDFLGLRNLDVIDEAVELIAAAHASPVQIDRIPLDDPKTYEMLQRGDATGVFQFESSGMREALRQVKPTEFEDLIALVALYRPGPMGYIPVYARRKNGQEEVSYIDPRLEGITGASYGICIYQEQYLEIAKQIAGFSPGEADDLRKAIGKKIHSLMASLKEKFLEGCVASGTEPAIAQQLWKDMEQSQDYSFNKSHAACYALIAYRTAWLRANYPAQYMAALISSVMNTKDRVPFYVNACEEIGIEVLPPRVNASGVGFAVVQGKIRFGLNAVKNVGEAACRAIVAAREADGDFTSIWDFVERVDPQVVNRRALESLVKAGAFDDIVPSRQGALNALDQVLGHGQQRHADRIAGQSSLFDGGESESHTLEPPRIDPGEFEKGELLKLEKETLGIFVSEHPLHAIRDQLRRKVDTPLADVERRRDGEVVIVGGIVSQLKALTTKKGDPMVFLRLDDLAGSTEVVVFNSVYTSSRELCEADRILVVKGRVDHKEGETKLLAMEIAEFEAAEPIREVTLRIVAGRAPAGIVGELKDVLRGFPGEIPVSLDVQMTDRSQRLVLGPEFKVSPVPDFYAEVKALLGEAAVL
jgi:DNA polymerase-3 subunit alpha